MFNIKKHIEVNDGIFTGNEGICWHAAANFGIFRSRSAIAMPVNGMQKSLHRRREMYQTSCSIQNASHGHSEPHLPPPSLSPSPLALYLPPKVRGGEPRHTHPPRIPTMPLLRVTWREDTGRLRPREGRSADSAFHFTCIHTVSHGDSGWHRKRRSAVRSYW